VVKRSGGRADPRRVKELLSERLGPAAGELAQP